MNTKESTIEFVNKVLEIALATSNESKENFRGIRIYSDGEIYALFEYSCRGEWTEETVSVTQKELEMGAEEAGRVWRVQQAEEKRVKEELKLAEKLRLEKEANEKEQRLYLELKAKFEPKPDDDREEDKLVRYLD